MEHDLVSTTLNFGCKIGNGMFFSLWTVGDVSVDFGFQLGKEICIHLSYPLEYRLDVSYNNIQKMELHRVHGSFEDYLLIQLSGAPRIYAKDLDSSRPECPNDRWIRSTDFTQFYCIGQSSAICFELPLCWEIPNFRKYFSYEVKIYYQEKTRKSFLQYGSALSCYQDLVPIVSPPSVDLPYSIVFKINMLIQHGHLSWPTLDHDFYRLIDPHQNDPRLIEYALEELFCSKETCYEPSVWLQKHYTKYMASQVERTLHLASLVDGMVSVYRINITPCRVYFCGPKPIVSNRVLRNFPQDMENFLRVSFVDEDMSKLYLADVRTRGIYERILEILKNGIMVGKKKFEFLAFSSSNLRDNSLWMFASRDGLTASDVRGWMGNFRHIQNVAKYAARLGQSFSQSTETLNVDNHEIEVIPDVVTNQGGVEYVFSDGIGKISVDFAKEVASKCGFEFERCTPSAFQIRYAGYKGVVAVDPTSSVKLSLRKSMWKFESGNTKLDVLAWSKFRPYFLNRQLITLLSTLGVPDDVFMEKQRAYVRNLDAMLTDNIEAKNALDLIYSGELADILKEMLNCSYEPNGEPFLAMMLQFLRELRLVELRTKSKILIQDGRHMMGCLDETRTLEYGQVFVQCSGSRHRQLIITQKVVVAKSPCLHPGDVRTLMAVDVPDLHHMVDCVVFPQRGSRPHTDECSGSDLDGDMYYVCWDPELIPPKNFEPMDYTPVGIKELDHEVTIEDVAKYFVDYAVSDSLGRIANAHIVLADKDPMKATCDGCIELAKLFSIAVDSAKTGIPAKIPKELRPREYPDFLEKPDKCYYQSSKVIGTLYREVKYIALKYSSITPFTFDMAKQSYDQDMEVDGFEKYLDDASHYKCTYDIKLRRLLDFYGIRTEAEIFATGFMRISKSSTKSWNTKSIEMDLSSLWKEARTWFNGRGTGSNAGADDAYAKASAWYFVTYHHSYIGEFNEEITRDHFISFPWSAHNKLMDIKRDKISMRRALHL